MKPTPIRNPLIDVHRDRIHFPSLEGFVRYEGFSYNRTIGGAAGDIQLNRNFPIIRSHTVILKDHRKI